MKNIFLLILFIILTSPPCPGIFSNPQTIQENLLKSGFLYRICTFTQWPEATPPNKPFIISILGKTSPGMAIKMPQNKTIAKRPIIIRKIKHFTEIKDSNVLFIAFSEAYRLDRILDYIKDKPILTVGDTPGFGQKGVIINFFIHMSRLRFEINYEASRNASLKMHSQLFSIGKVIKARGRFRPNQKR